MLLSRIRISMVQKDAYLAFKKSMKCFFILVICSLAVTAFTQPGKPGRQAGRHPNILFILTDDQRFSTIGILGREPVHTPAMDELARNGILFTQAHIMGGLQGAICMPSRAMLMTGKSLFHQHIDGEYISAQDIMMPQYFHQQGYPTFETGKWHNGPAALNRGFDSADNIYIGGMHSYESGGHLTPVLHHYDSTGQYKNAFTGDHFSSVYYADAIISFLDRQKNSVQPFFAYAAFTAPHDPRTPPSAFAAQYDSSKIALPLNFFPQHPFDNGEMDVRDEVLLPVPRNKEAVKGEIAKYYGMISEVDHEIGRIIEALKKNGQYDNTIIVFAGDNGLAVGQHGLLGKQNLYDHSIRVPLIIAGPGIARNKRSDAYVYLYDAFPSLCGLAGFKAPASLDGISFAQAAQGKTFPGRKQLFFVYANLQRAVKKNGYKLIRYNVNGASHEQLFNLSADPYETHNLAGEARYRGLVKELEQLLAEDMKKNGDFCNLTSPGWGYPGKLSYSQRKELYP